MFKNCSILLILCNLLFWLSSCNSSNEPITVIQEEEEQEECTKYSIDSSLIYIENSETRLIAGVEDHEYFNITDSDIDLCKLNQGLGREYFPALYDPEYSPISIFQYKDDMPCILLRDDGEIKIFPYSILSQRETINEVVNGDPIMIVYCELAELAAVYSRTYCGETFTFAPSGYTYFDDNYWNGVQGILLWDRETESLWWPLNDKALSGIMQGIEIKKAAFQIWEYISWGDVKKNYPEAISLSHTQNIVIPELPSYDKDFLSCN